MTAQGSGRTPFLKARGYPAMHRGAPAGYLTAAATTLGEDLPGDAEEVAARFLSWLSETSRPWLVVLDDLADAADLDGLWPAGDSGRVLITTRDPAAVSAMPGASAL